MSENKNGGNFQYKKPFGLKNLQMISILLFFMGGFFVFNVGRASAATYYVDESLGNNSNAGTSWSDAFAQIVKAESVASDGDTVRVKSGVYVEPSSPGGSTGNIAFAKAIDWIADDGNGEVGSVVVRRVSGSIVATFNGVKATVWNNFTFDGEGTASYVMLGQSAPQSNKTWNDCTFKDGASNGNSMLRFYGSAGSNNILNGINFSGTGSVGILTDASPVIINGGNLSGPMSFIRDSSASGVDIAVYDYTAVSNSPNQLVIAKHSLVLDNVNFTAPFIVNASGMHDVSIVDSQFVTSGTNANVAAIYSSSGNFTFTGNTINAANGTSVLFLIYTQDVSNLQISRNTINNLYSLVTTPINVSVSGASFVGTSYIGYNTITSINTSGYDIALGSETSGPNAMGNDFCDHYNNSVIEHNDIYGPYYVNEAASATHGIFVGHQRKVNIRYNKINGSGYCFVIKGSGSVGGDWEYDGGVYGNICVNNTYESGIYFKGVQRADFYNNVVYTANGLSPSSGGENLIYNNTNTGICNTGDSCPSAGDRIYNNIIIGNAGDNIISNNTDSTGLQIKNNIYWNWDGDPALQTFLYQGNAITGFPSWVSATSDMSNFANPEFNDTPSDFHLQSNSPAIDSGTDVGITTDYAGNPIYGAPDIGAYEYQPPYIIGSDDIDIGAGARIYGDGKFRDLGTASSTGADLKIQPENDFESFSSTEARPAWLDITSLTWTANQKQWTESSDDSNLTNTLHTIGDLTPGVYYEVAVDNDKTNIEGNSCTSGTCLADQNGKVIFTYTGHYSTHTFSVTPRAGEIVTDLTDAQLKITRNNKSNNQTLDEDNKVTISDDHTKISGKDTTIANGQVKIYKEGKRYATINVNSKGKWEKKISFSKNKTYELKLKFYDQFGTLRDTKEYNIKIDTQKPTFDEPIEPTQTVTKHQEISFTAKDETSFNYYKVKLLDQSGHIAKKWRKQKKDYYIMPEDVPYGTYTLIIRAYDSAGNHNEEKTVLNYAKIQKQVPEPQVQGASDVNSETAKTGESANDMQNSFQESTPPVYAPADMDQPKEEAAHWWNPWSWF